MLPLIETIVGFTVIMLLLSYLVKSLTSVLKNHYDYYSNNLEVEVKRLINGTIAQGIKNLDEKKKKLIENIQWKRLGEEYLSKRNMEWLLKKLGASDDDLKNLEERLNVHKANIKYAFEKRTKNISLILGIALCLGLNINSFTIWDTLYNDQQTRTKFSSQDATKFALETAEKNLIPGNKDIDRESLEKQREEFLQNFYSLRKDISFGLGKIWTEKVKGISGFLYEFIGSLLTGILVAIGAPYWHDILRLFSKLRNKPS
jgi:hypothetical protein